MKTLANRWYVWWLGWVAACAIGGCLVALAANVFGSRAALPFIGAIFALPQWPVLRARMPSAFVWVPVTGSWSVIAWFLSLIMGVYLGWLVLPLSVLYAVLLGAVMAAGQWDGPTALRPQQRGWLQAQSAPCACCPHA